MYGSYQADDAIRAESVKKSGRNANWRNSEGKYIKVKNMSNSYMLNLIKYIKRKEDYTSNILWRTWVTVLNKELIKRREQWKR